MIFENQAGASHKIAYRLRDQHVPRSGDGGDARAGMHCDSSNVASYKLAFTGMKAAPYFNMERAHRIADGYGTAHRPRRPVKGGEEAVT